MIKDGKQTKLAIMPLLFGFISAVILIAVFLNSPSNRYYNPDSGDKAYSDSASIAVMTPEIDSRAKTTREKNEQEKESYVRERSDLAAQWAMADYTFIGIWIGVIGIGFIIWTLIESRKAAYFTEGALAETKDNSRRELRAYVHAVPYGKNLQTTDGVPTIAIRLFNRGQTPAINILCEVSATLEGDEKPIVGDKFPVKMTIPPNSHEDIIWPLDESDMPEKWGVRMYFKIQFNDIFGADRYVDIGLDVLKSSFLDVEAYMPQKNWTRDIMEDVKPPLANPLYEKESALPYVAYGDDLQQEAKEYAKKNA